MELTEKEKQIVLDLINGLQFGSVHPESIQDFVGLKTKLEDSLKGA